MFSWLKVVFLFAGSMGASFSEPGDLLCRSSGMAGIAFGEKIEQQLISLVETPYSSVTYYRLEPKASIKPFKRLVVGVTPSSRRVFAISLEKSGDPALLDEIIKVTKAALSQSHSAISWLVIDNHHYGEQVEGLEIAIYRIGELINGKPSGWLTYDCVSKHFFGIVLKEVREATD